MKVFQVLVFGQLDDVDFDVAWNLATAPNPIFRTMEGAKAFVVKDCNEMRAELEGAPLYTERYVPTWFAYKDETDNPQWTYLGHTDDETGVNYRIVEVELQD